MKYPGSKKRLAKYLLPYIQQHTDRLVYVEPFVGGANMISQITAYPIRIGCDVNRYVVAALQAIQVGWIPPRKITEKRYRHIKEHKDLYHPALVGFAGVVCAYSGKWFDSYARDRAGVRNYAREGSDAALALAPFLAGILFGSGSYHEIPLHLFPPSAVYCDPPYKGTSRHAYVTREFDHDTFYRWCRWAKNIGHAIYVSEFDMPVDFKCIYEHAKETGKYVKAGNIERLFTL